VKSIASRIYWKEPFAYVVIEEIELSALTASVVLVPAGAPQVRIFYGVNTTLPMFLRASM
jgi:hypothetical protein